MPDIDIRILTKLVDTIVDHLDIPKSYYEKAVERHRSLGEWLCRPESRVALFQPQVSPQGSFRFGTVILPLRVSEEYDLDNVTTLSIPKTAMTQKQLKELYGGEIKEYANVHRMLAPVEEKDRCWRLIYADEVRFHLDTLPCIPEEPEMIRAIASRGAPPHLARLAVAITDRRHPAYAEITRALLSSNPRGFAEWFEERARPFASVRMRHLVEAQFYASVEDVPPYEWKTPLQRGIQFLKRHRDVMFQNNPSAGPISMIITNLAAHAYAGEPDLWSALTNIVNRMPDYVNETRPRVPNPADPAEDYGDKWAKDPTLEDNFWAWLTQARNDIANLSAVLTTKRLSSEIRHIFRVELTQDELKSFQATRPASTAAVVTAGPQMVIPSAPKPWG